MVEKPQPGLRERQRNHRGPLTGYQRIQTGRLPADAGSQLCHGGRLEQHPHRQARIQSGVDRGDQTHRRQRISAEIEERVIDPDPLHPEHTGVDLGQDLLGGGRRSPVIVDVLILGGRQRPGVQFSVGRQRQCRNNHHGGRDHVGRQLLGQLRTQLARLRRAGHVAHQPQIARAVRASDHGGLIDTVQTDQHGLDLPELDPVPANLDLLIRTSDIVQLAVGSPGDQVAGAVHPLSGGRVRATERAGNET
nr:hypothetical protein CPGR_00667 [Mycolicibacterium fortuitum subsp. fortuitum DSM 46621 = ATCC 6841 = JCM 6387]